MDKNKEVGLGDILNDNKKKLSNYKPRRENFKKQKSHRNPKKKITHRTNTSSTSSQKKHVTYSNIRTNTDIVDTLNCYQAANGFKSRSDLLSAMIKMCKPMLLNTKSKKEKFNLKEKAIELDRKLHNK